MTSCCPCVNQHGRCKQPSQPSHPLAPLPSLARAPQVAWVYGTTAALPFGTIVIIVVIWALVTFPLTVVGGIMGKNTKVGGRWSGAGVGGVGH